MLLINGGYLLCPGNKDKFNFNTSNVINHRRWKPVFFLFKLNFNTSNVINQLKKS